MSDLSSKILKTLLVVLCPILLIFGAVRALTTDLFLAFEYGKTSFPSDRYGFTPQQRFILASTNVHYVRAHLPDNELAIQTLNGTSVYNEREVSHMADVQIVFQYVVRTWQFALILFTIIGIVFCKNENWNDLASAIKMGGLITSTLILSIGLLAVFAWETLFNLFHRFLFVQGSWLFSYSDTLIRLFPAQFWFDATLALSALSFLGGSLFALAGWRGQRAASRYPLDVPMAS